MTEKMTRPTTAAQEPSVPDGSDMLLEQIPSAPHAAAVCHLAAMVADATVPTHASSAPIAPAESATSPHDGDTLRLVLVDVTGAGRACAHCGTMFTPKRPHGRFCSPTCRRASWMAAHPERAAVLNEQSLARLRAHIESRGGPWIERHRLTA